MKIGAFPAAAIALFALSACGRATNQELATVDPNAPATVKITNNNQQDVDVFLERGGERLRLGMVTTGQSQTFSVPAVNVSGRSDVRIFVHPIGGGGDYVTEQLVVNAGETVDLQVAQQLPQSRVMKTGADAS